MSATVAMTLLECSKHLASIVGEAHSHLADDSAVAAPADVNQASKILGFANSNGIVVNPIGGGTKRGWGNSVAAGIRLDLKRMSALREHAWQDMTCTIGAGSTWTAMQTELARHGQMVAIDPLWPEKATVGGIVATNDGGALRLKYGGLRDLIIGMTIVLADGTIARTGGKVVKNVAGYDLHKLMTGGFGTLGVIAEVNFRLHPLEVHVKTWSATSNKPDMLEAALHALLDSQLTPSSVQLRVEKGVSALDLRIAALPECMDRYCAQLRDIFGPIELVESGEQVWQARQALFDLEGATVLKVSLLPGKICAISAELQRFAEKEGIEVFVAAQATGLMTIALKSSPEAAIALVDFFRQRLKESGGSIVALQIPNTLHNRLDVWGYDSNALPLMREIKRRFDPNRILNPGLFVGNI